MKILVSIAILSLQRVPLVNRIPFIRDANTIERALSGLMSAVTQLSDVAGNHRRAENDLGNVLDTLEAERLYIEAQRAHIAEAAAKAERFVVKLTNLLS